MFFNSIAPAYLSGSFSLSQSLSFSLRDVSLMYCCKMQVVASLICVLGFDIYIDTYLKICNLIKDACGGDVDSYVVRSTT